MASIGGSSQPPREKSEGPFVTRHSDEEVHMSSPHTLAHRDRHPGLGMAFETGTAERPERDVPADSRTRWSSDDTRREEYWRGYYDSKRREKERDLDRESSYYPDHRRNQRYIDYDDDRVASRPYRAASRRTSRAPPPPSMQNRGSRYDHGADLPSKRHYESDEEDDYEGPYIARPARRGPPNKNPPRNSSISSDGMRIPFTRWMNGTLKGHFVAAIGEFVGTTMFLFFAFAGTQVANVGGQNKDSSTTGGATGFSPQVLLYISLVFGFSLMVNVWVFFRISGGLFNPAVTLAMAMTRSITVFRALLLVAVQLGGSIFASFLVKVMFPTEFKVRTTLSAETSLVRGVFIEAVLTFELVFTIFLLAKEKHKATFIAPVGIGLALFIAELVGVYYTGGSLNPARSFGPCVVTGIFDKEHWIYWVGPGTGAIAAVIFYKFIKILEYELANPGQDESSEKGAKIAADDAENGIKPPEHQV